MESVSTHTSQQQLSLPGKKPVLPSGGLVLPSVLRCLLLTDCEERSHFLCAAAQNESWEPTVNLEVHDFLRNLFRLRFPLAFIDLPVADSGGYSSVQQAAMHAAEMRNSQLVICGNESCTEEEIWARGLGVWAYLPGDSGLAGLEFIFREARQALANTAITYVELEAYR